MNNKTLLCRRVWPALWLLAVAGAAAFAMLSAHRAHRVAAVADEYVVLAANELGMHCMQNDFSQMMILPPFNSLQAQVIRRGIEPDVMNGGVSVSFVLPTNTHSSDKTNFWSYAQSLLGVPVATDVGVTGTPMSGLMTYDAATAGWLATGIPVTPIDDDGKENPYPLALVQVTQTGQVVARTQAVVPVSWEMSCNLCHNTPGESTATSILKSHDRLHGTNLIMNQPVMCASCHSDNALGAPGQPGISSLSRAMHGAHATRMGEISLDNSCYACHPGVRTNCQRDVHAGLGISCVECHGGMSTVANPTRNPWVDMPRCGDCHQRAGFEFEQAGKLYRTSFGHGGVSCMSCHGSPHASGAAVTEKDNAQAVRVQDHVGVINTCSVCHTTQPSEAFFHRRNE